MARIAIYGVLLFGLGIFCPVSSKRVGAVETGLPCLLVLRNGNILRGEITRRGSFYRVVMPQGELRVPVGHVELFCRSLEEAYRQRRAARIGSTADSHRQLAAWCLRNDMFDYAAMEAREARAIEPDCPGLKILEKQIAQATRNAHRPRVQFHPDSDSIAGKLATPVSNRKLPRAARRQFVRQIEPILLHSCATSGCHGIDSAGSFHLDRLAIVGAGHPGLTRKNLASVLKQVDDGIACADSLLTRATTSHGAKDSRSQPLNTRQVQLLRSWIRLLPPTGLAARGEADAKRVVTSRQAPKGKHVTPAIWETHGSAPEGKEPLRSIDALPVPPKSENLHPTKPPRRGARLTTFQPRDPFDPEIFNRRVARKNPAASQSSDD